MEFWGYIAALLIGLSLGLVGAGGSILTLPVLVYLFGRLPSIATAYSLVIVGITAALGSAPYFRARLVDLRVALVFGPPSIAAVYLVRAFVLPAMPEILFNLGPRAVTRDEGIMFLFAVLMLGAALKMIRPESPRAEQAPRRLNFGLVLVEGAAVGAVTGLVGAGGGFLIVPVLVLLAGSSFPVATGTSLVLIAAKSLIGFVGDVQKNSRIEWSFLAAIAAISVMGIFLRAVISQRIEADRLRRVFGWFLVVMAVFMVLGELLD